MARSNRFCPGHADFTYDANTASGTTGAAGARRRGRRRCGRGRGGGAEDPHGPARQRGGGAQHCAGWSAKIDRDRWDFEEVDRNLFCPDATRRRAGPTIWTTCGSVLLRRGGGGGRGRRCAGGLELIYGKLDLDWPRR